MKKTLPLLVFSIFHYLAYGAIYTIGNSGDYPSPNALYNAQVLQDGDTIYITAQTYTGTEALAVWQQNDLYILGIDGRPHLVADGQYIWGKGIWVLSGNNIHVENIEFSGATVPDNNGAGIRLDGTGLTVRYCYFHDNENGILTGNPGEGDILIEYTEFDHNGYGEGYTHNLYIGHVGSLTFRWNYSHHAKIGHNLKSRAAENYILYNRIMDEESGTSSRLIDLPNGGFSIIMGNLLMQGNNAPNNNLIGYGLEGLSNPNNELYIINNTMVNKRVASCLFIDVEEGAFIVDVRNNIFAGTGNLLDGNSTTLANNLLEENIAALGFVDEANYDYHLLQGSLAIDHGGDTGMQMLTPNSQYLHPTGSEERSQYGQTIDAGAYEFLLSTSTVENTPSSLMVFPNPFDDWIYIHSCSRVGKLQVVNSSGVKMNSYIDILYQGENALLRMSHLPKGVYYLVVNGRSKLLLKK